MARLVQCVNYSPVSSSPPPPHHLFIRFEQHNKYSKLVNSLTKDRSQNGPYDSKHLNLEALDEPFPVKATIRGEEYKSLILKEALEAEVLDEAK